jgi:type III pantothenate kinase
LVPNYNFTSEPQPETCHRRHIIVSTALLININNSFSKAAVWQDGQLKLLGRQPSSKVTTTHFERWIQRSAPDQIVLCSVVPEVNRRLPPKSAIPVHAITHKSPLGIRINFPRPASIGADRLANAAAVNACYSVPAVVIDYGTAVTFDIISKNGEYLGGVITPGMRVFRDYLAERTALLPRIHLSQPEHVIGKSTREAMRAGAYYGYRGLVREILAEIKRELGAKRLAILATGGDSDLFTHEDNLFDIHDPDLSFKGMSVVADQLPKSSK